MPPRKYDLPNVPSVGDNAAHQDDDVFSNPELAEDLYQLTMFGEAAADSDQVAPPAAVAHGTALATTADSMEANMPNSGLGDNAAVQTATVLDDYAFPMSPNTPQPAPAGVGFADAAVVEDGPAAQVVVTGDAHDNAYATVVHVTPFVEVLPEDPADTEPQTLAVAAADTNAVQPETPVAGGTATMTLVVVVVQ